MLCHQCDKVFSSRFNLSRHLETIHRRDSSSEVPHEAAPMVDEEEEDDVISNVSTDESVASSVDENGFATGEVAAWHWLLGDYNLLSEEDDVDKEKENWLEKIHQVRKVVKFVSKKMTDIETGKVYHAISDEKNRLQADSEMGDKEAEKCAWEARRYLVKELFKAVNEYESGEEEDDSQIDDDDNDEEVSQEETVML